MNIKMIDAVLSFSEKLEIALSIVLNILYTSIGIGILLYIPFTRKIIIDGINDIINISSILEQPAIIGIRVISIIILLLIVSLLYLKSLYMIILLVFNHICIVTLDDGTRLYMGKNEMFNLANNEFLSHIAMRLNDIIDTLEGEEEINDSTDDEKLQE